MFFFERKLNFNSICRKFTLSQLFFKKNGELFFFLLYCVKPYFSCKLNIVEKLFILLLELFSRSHNLHPQTI